MIFWKNWFLRTLYLWCVREAPKGYSSHQLEFAACSGPKWEGKWENNLLHCQTNGDNRALFPAPKFIKPSDYRMNDRTSSIILAFAWKLRSATNMFYSKKQFYFWSESLTFLSLSITKASTLKVDIWSYVRLLCQSALTKKAFLLSFNQQKTDYIKMD